VQENNCYTVSWSCNCDIFASLPTCGLSPFSVLFVFVFTHPSSWLVVASVGVGKEGGRRGVVDEALSSYHCASSRWLAFVACALAARRHITASCATATAAEASICLQHHTTACIAAAAVMTSSSNDTFLKKQHPLLDFTSLEVSACVNIFVIGTKCHKKEFLIELTSTKFFKLLYFVPLYILVFLGSSEKLQKDHPTGCAKHLDTLSFCVFFTCQMRFFFLLLLLLLLLACLLKQGCCLHLRLRFLQQVHCGGGQRRGSVARCCLRSSTNEMIRGAFMKH
jgi:hypothetical protein